MSRYIGGVAAGAEAELGPTGWTKLGSSFITTASTSLGTVSWASWGLTYDVLYVYGRITGYSNLDRPLMTFNGSGTGYTDRWLSANTAASATFTNGQNASSAGIRWANTDVQTGRVVTCFIANNGNEKLAVVEETTGSGAAGTQIAHHHIGQGTWNNAASITSIGVATIQARTFNTGSGFIVYGARAGSI